MNSGEQKKVVAVGPRVMGAFLDEMGGAEEFGRSIHEDYARTRQKAIEKGGDDNVVEKRLQGYTKDVLTKLVDIDRFHHDTGEFEDVSDADLAALLMEQAIEKITTNPVFASKMLSVVRDNQPSLFQQLLVTGEIPEASEVIDVTFEAELPGDLLALGGPDFEEELPDNLFDSDPDEPAGVGGELVWQA